MKRRLFFWIDKLQIQRNERIVLSWLMLLAMILSTIVLFADLSPSPDHYDYSELERVFRERSEQQQKEQRAIMARYSPVPDQELNAGNQDRYTDKSKLDQQKSLEDVKSLKTKKQNGVSADTTVININRADADRLQELPGIGPTYASRIIEWRKENGKFESVDQLLEIRGIGPKRLEKIKPLVIL
ncbi:MAG: hypothetical protein GVY08_01870 [Bacteroidetes bacterium]|jgi:competence protein ComEA|nr:hypothetical protein [Bacteroidota bacterium]